MMDNVSFYFVKGVYEILAVLGFADVLVIVAELRVWRRRTKQWLALYSVHFNSPHYVLGLNQIFAPFLSIIVEISFMDRMVK